MFLHSRKEINETLERMYQPSARRGIRAINLLWKVGTHRRKHPPVFISGAPRSGTTWVLETLEGALDVRRHWEPIKGLQADHGPISRYKGGLRPLVQSPDDNPHFQEFMHKVFDDSPPLFPGQARSRNFSKLENLKKIANPAATIVKFTAAQRAMSWVSETFDNRGVILLRNPLSLIASLKAMETREDGWTEHMVPHGVPSELRDRFPKVTALQNEIVKKFDEVAIRACLDTIMPVLASSSRSKGGIAYIDYESLVSDPSKFSDLLDWLGLEAFQHNAIDPTRPSTTTRGDSNVSRGGNPNLSWQHRLSTDEVDRVLQIMDQFGIDFYGPDVVDVTRKLKPYNLPVL